MRFTLVQPSILPGFKLAFGFSFLYLILIILIPIAGLFVKAASLSFASFWATMISPRILHAYIISFGLSFLAALINSFFGLIISWTLVRYRFPGKKIFDAIIDLPLALPTAVAGIALTSLYMPQGWLGRLLLPLGIKVAFTPLGILVALIFISLPFIVRTIQPVLLEIDKEAEECSAILGASRWQTFRFIIMPHIIPALLTGFSLAFARALGEYGSVIFIAGNIPKVSEIIPLIIVIKTEQYDYASASAIAVVMLMASLMIFTLISLLQIRYMNRKSV